MNRRVLLILLLAALLNIWGISWGAPNPAYFPSDVANHTLNSQALVHPDAFHFAARSFRMAATGDWNPHFFENPSLYININMLMHLLSGAASGHPVPADHYPRAYAPFPPYLMARAVSALAGVLMAAFTFALGRLAFGVRAGELAALLAAVSFVVVQHSHYATTNVTAAALATGALWLSLRIIKSSNLRAAGLMVGLAGSAKYNAGVVGSVYVVAGLLDAWRRRAWKPLAWGLVAVGVGFLVGTPFAVLDPRTFWRDFRYITSQYVAGQGYPETPYGLVFHLAHIAWYGIGPVAAVLGVWAVARSTARFAANFSWQHNRTRLYTALILLYLAAYSVIVLKANRLGDHLTVPVVGAAAALAGAGAAQAMQKLEHPLLKAGLTAAFVAVPLAYSVHFGAMLARPDTRETALAWIHAHVEPGTPVYLVTSYNVPLDPAIYPAEQYFGLEYQPPEARGDAPVVVVSDAIRFLFDGSEPFIPSEWPAYAREQLARYDAELTQAARFERPRWFGDAWPLSTAAYFHNPTITVYCDRCAEVIHP